MAMRRLLVTTFAAASLAALPSGCAKDTCLGGEKNCRVAAPCGKIAFSCDAADGAALQVFRLDSPTQRPQGTNALAVPGDVMLKNKYAQVVIADIGHRHYVDPNGGSILDLSATGNGQDGINQIIQGVGLLPRDAAYYTSLEIIDERPTRVAVQVKGTLDGQPNTIIATRYEMTPCDPGVRVRTEVLNASPDALPWALLDGYYWSADEPIPFAPGKGSGFAHPSFGLTSLDTVFRPFPYMAGTAHNGERAAFATASCTTSMLEGLHSDVISVVGTPRTLVPTRGLLTFDRFIGVADGRSTGAAADIALEVRRQVTGEKLATITGSIDRVGALRLDSERETSVIVSEGKLTDAVEARTPWAHAVPGTTGKFQVKVPAGKSYVVEVHSFGRKHVEKEFQVDGDRDVGAFTLPSTGVVNFEVRDQNMGGLDAEIFVVPADETTRERVQGSFHGQFDTCSPWLGPPPGASPACNRVLLRNGQGQAELPLGKFHLYAFHGPFWTLARRTEDIMPGTARYTFQLKPLALQPTGTLNADLHVHGAASFDSAIPDYDRVLSFSASDLEVIVSTDHDVIYSYDDVVKQLNLQGRMTAVTGLETTGHIPWLYVPGYGYPLVVGHFNFWPMTYNPTLSRNGVPEDELVEPGQLFDNVKAMEPTSVPPGTQLIELNHPWAPTYFGRDMGFARAIFMDLRQDLPKDDDGTNNGVYVRKPRGASFRNSDHHAQEVMNGSQNDALLQYRAFWWYVLNQGHLRTGTANSDSHSLTDNTAGMPRNVVWTSTAAGPGFDVVPFNTAIKQGRVLGTNGPIIEASITTPAGERPWSFEPIKPAAGAQVKVRVRSAPWIPVQEIRFVVNGKVVKTVPAAVPAAADPFGDGDLDRYEGQVPLDDLLTGVSGDAWLVIEAGRALATAADLGGGLDDGPDGMPDTTDNNGDGKIDQADVAKGATYGPLANPPAPSDTDVAWHYFKITDGYPFSFTNPFILDRNGNGLFDAPGVNGGR